MSVSERDAAGLLEDDTEPSAPVPQSRPTQLQRLAGPGLFTAPCIVAFCCYLRMSSTLPANSDFGRPEQIYDLGRYTVLVWRQNLLQRLS